MTLQQFRAHVINKQNAIVYESDDDEGAMDYYGELQSIIDAIDNGQDVQKACEWVGVQYLVTTSI